jgi:hypothetical protein
MLPAIEPLAGSDHDLLIGLARDVEHMRKMLDRLILDHERRIRVLENFRWWLLGGLVSSPILAAAAAKVFR